MLKQKGGCGGWGGHGVFSFIVGKRLGSVFVGNWPRLQTSINQSHAHASNKDTAVITLQQMYYFKKDTFPADVLIHNDCTSHHWLAALPITWPPTVCSIVLSGTRNRWRAPTLGSASTRLHYIQAFMRLNSILTGTGPTLEEKACDVIFRRRLASVVEVLSMESMSRCSELYWKKTHSPHMLV